MISDPVPVLIMHPGIPVGLKILLSMLATCYGEIALPIDFFEGFLSDPSLQSEPRALWIEGDMNTTVLARHEEN